MLVDIIMLQTKLCIDEPGVISVFYPLTPRSQPSKVKVVGTKVVSQ